MLDRPAHPTWNLMTRAQGSVGGGGAGVTAHGGEGVPCTPGWPCPPGPANELGRRTVLAPQEFLPPGGLAAQICRKFNERKLGPSSSQTGCAYLPEPSGLASTGRHSETLPICMVAIDSICPPSPLSVCLSPASLSAFLCCLPPCTPQWVSTLQSPSC